MTGFCSHLGHLRIQRARIVTVVQLGLWGVGFFRPVFLLSHDHHVVMVIEVPIVIVMVIDPLAGGGHRASGCGVSCCVETCGGQGEEQPT